MPVVEYAAGKAADRLSGGHALAVAAGMAVVAALVLMASRSSSPTGGGFKVPSATTENIPLYTFQPPPDQPMVGPQDHVGGFVFLPNRYPPLVGGELTAVMNYGHATLTLPHERDVNWITAPPSEVSL